MKARIDITEESGIHKEWMERARNMTLEALPEFLRELTEDYAHDYGTICHAIASAAVAAAWAVERTPQGGITGFQASAVTWELIHGWNPGMSGTMGARIQRMDDLLYPQHVDKFNTITADAWERVQKEAQKRLDDETSAHPDVTTHWQSIVDGTVPFDLKVEQP